MSDCQRVCRGVRGATTADANTSEEILKTTRQLLALMIRQNGIDPEDVASAIFTVTHDLDAEFPALAARQLGWLNVALMCGYELSVPGSLGRCVRVLLHWNTEKAADEIVHVYIKDAAQLRPDLAELPPVDWDELEHWIKDHLNESARSSRVRYAPDSRRQGAGQSPCEPLAAQKPMSDPFDPYYQWLGIPPEEQPPDHYRLLGVKGFEDDREVIRTAADRQTVHLQTFQIGERSQLARKLINEVAAAKLCLLTPAKKLAYDRRLRERQAASPREHRASGRRRRGGRRVGRDPCPGRSRRRGRAGRAGQDAPPTTVRPLLGRQGRGGRRRHRRGRAAGRWRWSWPLVTPRQGSGRQRPTVRRRGRARRR